MLVARIWLPDSHEQNSFGEYVLWCSEGELKLNQVLAQFFADPAEYMLKHFDYLWLEPGSADHLINFEELDL